MGRLREPNERDVCTSLSLKPTRVDRCGWKWRGDDVGAVCGKSLYEFQVWSLQNRRSMLSNVAFGHRPGSGRFPCRRSFRRNGQSDAGHFRNNLI